MDEDKNMGMKKGKRVLLVLMIVCIVGTISCRRNRLHVNDSGVTVDLKLDRFEHDLFSIPPDSLVQKIPYLQEKYGLFLKRFGELIHIGEPGEPVFSEYLETFVTDTLIRNLYNKTEEVFPDVKALKKKLTRSFKYYSYYFPQKRVPEIITYISGFNASLMIGQHFLGIGLDRYLGDVADYYDRLGIPKYMQRNMVPDKIVPDVCYALGQTDFPFNGLDPDSFAVQDNVLNHMIYEGKLLYFVNAMLPGEQEEIIMGYTPKQLKWCKMNEGQMWAFMIEKKLLFSTNYMTINKLTRDAPFTSYFPQESPGRAANWIGWQIVKAYMDRHPETPLPVLMENADYQQILNESGYSPR
jgi:hypothetical protein